MKVSSLLPRESLDPLYDFDYRMEFCKLILKKIDDDSNFLFNIVFSNEAI